MRDIGWNVIKRWIWAAVLVGINAGHARAEVPLPRHLGCLGLGEVQSDHTARDLAGAVRACVEADRMGDAVGLFIAYSSYGLFDQQRVRDESAHLVLNDLNLWIFNGYSRTQMTALSAMIDQFRDANSLLYRQTCAAIAAIGPPTYRPDYMIGQGTMPRRDAKDWGVDGFDPRQAWHKALIEVNGCPAT